MRPLLFLLSAVATVFCGCRLFEVNNNYLEPEDFAAYLQKAGIKVQRTRPLNPIPLAATKGVELLVAGSGIGVYKYDRTIESNVRRLDRIRESGKVYFGGIPYPVYEVSGSFIIVGLDKNPEKNRILEVLRNFK